MSLRVMCVFAIAWTIGCWSLEVRSECAQSPPPELGRGRSFTVTYIATVPACPAGAARLDVWVPVPSSDAQQTISDVSSKTDLPGEIQTEREYHNRALHVWNDRRMPASIELTYQCTRYEEHSGGEARQCAVSHNPVPSPRDLGPDQLGVIDDRVRRTAREVTAGRTDTLAQARALYDHVISHMVYDKTSPGWGRGDTVRACEVGKGNCTDFHALFISLARAQGIPARFGIGLQMPVDRREGSIEGYHCWAEFWVAGTGWVPVDCSEGWKHPERHDYYFGSLDDNRARLSVGRDVRLVGMRGPALNYFLWPYAEADGKPIPIAHATITYSAGPATGNGRDVPVSPSHRGPSP